jgi:translation initiation factor IF-2
LLRIGAGNTNRRRFQPKTGLNIDLLLEKVLLEAELLDLKANPDKPSIGTIIESVLTRAGLYFDCPCKAGTLHVGDIVIAGASYGHIKAMYNERAQKSMLWAGTLQSFLV